jgi:hypothetical protein
LKILIGCHQLSKRGRLKVHLAPHSGFWMSDDKRLED